MYIGQSKVYVDKIQNGCNILSDYDGKNKGLVWNKVLSNFIIIKNAWISPDSVDGVNHIVHNYTADFLIQNRLGAERLHPNAQLINKHTQNYGQM